jgi:hypothetical protein
VYTEDAIHTHFANDPSNGQPPLPKLQFPLLPLAESAPVPIDPSSPETLQRSTVEMTMRHFGSLGNILAVSSAFFTGTHQRISAISRPRFDRNVQSLTTSPHADFVALCMCVLLVQQVPLGKTSNMQSSLYFIVKNLIRQLEMTNGISVDHVNCRVLITFYEMGHGLHTAAYISVIARRTCNFLS